MRTITLHRYWVTAPHNPPKEGRRPMNLAAAQDRGRDNNFNALRLAAALAVLISHSWFLTGAGIAEPLRRAVGMTLGDVAVDIFFATSGFLVTASLLRRESLSDFVASRVLRIYPALFVMVLSCIALGAAFTTLPLWAYLTHPVTRDFILSNASMIGGAAFQLPGVFEKNPYPAAVNGSLWTLPWELRLYAALACIWVLTWVFGRRRRAACETAVVVLAVVATVMLLIPKIAPGVLPARLTFGNRFVPVFLSGGAYFVLRRHVSLRWAWAACAAGLLVTGAIWMRPAVFEVVYFLVMPYLVLWLAYVPRAPRWFASDYSYGVYIFAFPVQQSLAALVPGIHTVQTMALAIPVTLLIAWCSWHAIEHPVLRRKEGAITALRRMLPMLAAPA